MRRGLILMAGLAGAVLVLAGCDAGAFQMRASSLERSLAAQEAAGVPAASLAPARLKLQQIESQRSGPIPYAVISGSLVVNPLSQVEKLIDKARADATAEARAQAASILAALHATAGPNDDAGYFSEVAELGKARTPRDYQRLARDWTQQLDALKQIQASLAQASGGLSAGLPKDVVDGSVRLHGLATALEGAGLPVSPAWDTEADVQMYLARPYAQLAAQHQPIIDELNSTLTLLQQRQDEYNGVKQSLDKATRLMPQLLGEGAGGDFQSRIDQLKQRLGQIPDDATLAKVQADAAKLVKDMQAAYQGNLPVPATTDPGACIPGAPAYMIIIHLNTQDLTAYNNGCPWLHTLVTTGRPALPTDRGTFQIFAKYPSYHMISPWPKGSPFWYHDAWVADAMEFVADGTFIHGASWQPNGTYGPGSQYGPYASHGCVHVAPLPLSQLYAWAPIGTTVTVTS